MDMDEINTKDVEDAAQHAKEARAGGHTVLVYRFNDKMRVLASSRSRPLPGAGAQIQVIEAQGWILAHVVSRGEHDLTGIFRRTT